MKSNFFIARSLFTKRFFLLLITIVLMAGLLSGCSSKTKQKTKTTEENTGTESTELTPQEGPNKILQPQEEEQGKESDTVIAPNTVHDPDESSNNSSDTTNNSGNGSQPASDTNPTATPKPVVDPETEPNETPELDEETANDMIPLFDSLILAACEYGDNAFDPASPDYVWMSIYLAMVNYAEDGQNGVYYTDDYMYKIVPANLVLEYASGMFSGMKKLPAVPDSQKSSASYLADQNAYQFASSDRGASYTVITGITPENNGTYLVDTSLRTHSDDSTYVVHGNYTFRVKPNPSVEAGVSHLFPFAVTELVSVSGQ